MKFKYDMEQDDMSEDDVYNDWQTGSQVCFGLRAPPIVRIPVFHQGLKYEIDGKNKRTSTSSSPYKWQKNVIVTHEVSCGPLEAPVGMSCAAPHVAMRPE